MKAVVLYGKGKTELRDVPVPEIGDGDILLEIKAAGICGGDVHFYDGTMDGLGGYRRRHCKSRKKRRSILETGRPGRIRKHRLCLRALSSMPKW